MVKRKANDKFSKSGKAKRLPRHSADSCTLDEINVLIKEVEDLLSTKTKGKTLRKSSKDYLQTVCRPYFEDIDRRLTNILIVISFILFILAANDAMYIVVTGIEVGVVILFIILYLLMLDTKIKCFKWPRVDFLNCIVSGVIIFIVCCIAIDTMYNDLMISSGVLGLIESGLSGMEAFYLYREGCLKK